MALKNDVVFVEGVVLNKWQGRKKILPRYKCNLEKVLVVASVICQLLTSDTLAYIYIRIYLIHLAFIA